MGYARVAMNLARAVLDRWTPSVASALMGPSILREGVSLTVLLDISVTPLYGNVFRALLVATLAQNQEGSATFAGMVGTLRLEDTACPLKPGNASLACTRGLELA